MKKCVVRLSKQDKARVLKLLGCKFTYEELVHTTIGSEIVVMAIEKSKNKELVCRLKLALGEAGDLTRNSTGACQA